MVILRKHYLFISVLLFAGVFALFALPVFAQEGIVQCGRGTGASCSICDIPPTLNRLMSYVILNFVTPAAILMVMAGGFMILTAGAAPQRLETGKKILTNTLIGVLFIFFSWLIVNTILVVISGEQGGVGGFQGMGDFLPWNELNRDCGLGDVASTGGGFPPSLPPQPPSPPQPPPPPPLGGEWTFDPGIQNQLSDASASLNNLLSCMRSKLPPGVGRISSISDSRYIGNLSACNVSPCPANCAHGCGSCHYGGGGGGGKSLAVDFGDENNKLPLIGAAQACGISSSHIIDEGDHIHISTNDCPKN